MDTVYAFDIHRLMIADGDKIQKQFWKFMEVMGHKIDLETWSGYRGDMGKKGTTFYDRWVPADGMGTVDGRIGMQALSKHFSYLSCLFYA